MEPMTSVADMDSDGGMDIVASSIHDDTIRWFENNGNINYISELL